jgi:hypothetical protein
MPAATGVWSLIPYLDTHPAKTLNDTAGIAPEYRRV